MNMTKRLLPLALATAILPLAADVMDKKATVLRTVRTPFSGPVEITCDDPQGWTFDVSAAVDDGRDVVTVRLSRPDDAAPPKFGVFYRVPGAGVQNVWVSDNAREGLHLWARLWWNGRSHYDSELANESPIAVGFNSTGVSPVALACSEAKEHVVFGLYAEERSCDVIGRCEFFSRPVAPRKAYSVRVMLDRRGRDWAETVTACSRWIAKENGFRTADVPEAAFDPLYSTWYAYLQDVHAADLEREARLAAEIGMKTMILDDGWQKVASKTFYSATGDWMPVADRFPDMKAHVAEVHKAGLKYMLWLAVPFMGSEAKNRARFEKMLLSGGDTGLLDPRFPEVREYLISTYERAVRDWGFDGLKLDFIDAFQQPKDDPALKDGFAGRDYRSVPEALDRLMKDVRARLQKINPEILLEFRQHYNGPAILQYGNMMRCADCPADPVANRRRVCDLRLTSDRLAVHSDMLVWSAKETPEGAALPILNVLFSTIQYSMILADVSPEHRQVIAAWLRFSQEHREALLKGAFRPHHPELGYTWVEGESAAERVIAAYADDVCVRAGAPVKPVFLVNATGRAGLLAELAAKPAKIELYDVFGRKTGEATAAAGLVRLPIPASGYAKVAWTAQPAAGAAQPAAVRHLTAETPAEKEARLKWWTDARFGMFIHFGLYSLPARHEWYKMNDRVSEKKYDEFFARFDPDLFDAKEWARQAKATGMKYVVLTAKHHEGFCLWDSKFTDYKATKTPFGRDLVREYADAFRAEGIRVGLYYSLIDWHHPDFTIDDRHPRMPPGCRPGDVSGVIGGEAAWDRINAGKDMARYRRYMKDQVRELLTDYGKIDVMWFDFSYPQNGKHGKGHLDWDSEGILKLARELQPQIIIDNRLDLMDTADGWDFVTPEQFKAVDWPTVRGVRAPWETCQTFSGSWGYYRDEATWKSLPQLVELLSETVSKGGNLILNVGPTARGEFDARAKNRLAGMADWMRVNARSIYGCTEPPPGFTAPNGTALTYNPATKRLYIHLYDYPMGKLVVDFWEKIEYAQFLHDASEIKVAGPGKRHSQAGEIRPVGGLLLPVVKPAVAVPVVELWLK